MQEYRPDDNIIKREMISSDKDGTLEKVWERPYDRVNEDGTTEHVEPWEVRATGRKVKELSGAFKETGPAMLHEQAEAHKKVGMQKVTLPGGRVDEFPADKVAMLRESIPGACSTRLRPGIMMPQMPWHKPCGHSKHQQCHCEGIDG